MRKRNRPADPAFSRDCVNHCARSCEAAAIESMMAKARLLGDDFGCVGFERSVGVNQFRLTQSALNFYFSSSRALQRKN